MSSGWFGWTQHGLHTALISAGIVAACEIILTYVFWLFGFPISQLYDLYFYTLLAIAFYWGVLLIFNME